MLILLILSICLSIPMVDLYNAIVKNKIKNYIFILAFISIFQIISVTLIGYFEVSNHLYQIITNLYVVAFFLASIIFILFNFIKNKKEFNFYRFKSEIWESFKKKIILYISIIIFIIISLFQTNQLEDTLHYLEISTNFINGQNTQNYNYIIPGSYYFYATFSEGFVSQWYYIFTPISFFIILSSIINDYVTNIFVGKYKYLQIFSILFFVTLFSVFSAPTMISGNVYISACLIGLYMICLKQRDYNSSALLLIGTQFFSSTGLILSLILFASTFIYFLIYKKISTILKMSSLYLFSLYALPLLLLSFMNIKYGELSTTWAYVFVACFATFIALIISLNYFFARKKIINKFLNFSLINTKWFSTNTMKYIILFISVASMIILIVYFQVIYFQPFVYSMIPFYIGLCILFPFVIFNYIKQFKQEENINLVLLINISLVSLVMIFIWIFNVEQGSIWRLMMLLPTISIGESTISLCVLISINLSIAIPFIKQFDFWSFNKINLLKSSKLTTITISSITIIASFIPATIVTINPAMTNYVWNTYSADVEKNINLFSINDIEKMKSLSKTTVISNWNFVFDNQASAYISFNEIHNYSYRFYKSLFEYNNINDVGTDERNNPIGSLGFYNSRLISPSWKNNYIIKQSLEEFGNWLNVYLNSNSWASDVDVIFLGKNRDYYKYLNFNLSGHLVYDSNLFESITVITKNQQILNTIKNSV